jgi:hypothetical protein
VFDLAELNKTPNAQRVASDSTSLPELHARATLIRDIPALLEIVALDL